MRDLHLERILEDNETLRYLRISISRKIEEDIDEVFYLKTFRISSHCDFLENEISKICESLIL